MTERSHNATTAPKGRRDRRLVVGYCLVALVVSGALGIVQSHTGLNGGIVELTQGGPIVAVVVLFVLSPRVRRLITMGLQVDRRSVAALATATLAVLATMCCYRVILAAMGASASGLTARDWPGPMALVVPAQLAGALAEEAGWRGVLQPLLRRHLPLVPASGAVGLIWALWHVPTISSGIAIAVQLAGRLEIARSGGAKYASKIGAGTGTNREQAPWAPVLQLASADGTPFWLAARLFGSGISPQWPGDATGGSPAGPAASGGKGGPGGAGGTGTPTRGLPGANGTDGADGRIGNHGLSLAPNGGKITIRLYAGGTPGTKGRSQQEIPLMTTAPSSVCVEEES